MARILSIDGSVFKKMIQGGAARLKAHKAEINELNVFPVPDGDTGDNMYLTYSSGLNSMASSSDSLGETASSLSRGMLFGARGNSGVILSQFFSGIAKKLAGKDSASSDELADALLEGVHSAYSAVATPTEGTMLTVAREGVNNALAKADNSSVNALFDKLKEEMRSSLDDTPNKLPILKEAGVVDSGGAGLCYVIEGMADALSGREDQSPAVSSDVSAASQSADTQSFGKDSVMTYGYCTELLLQLQTAKADVDSFDASVITDYLKTVGDSIVSFKDGTIVKVHVHTMTPEKVLGFCRRFGEFLTVKIENMSVQHSSRIQSVEKEEDTEQKRPEKECAVIAVCSGDGIKRTFEDLGVDFIIDGGQTSNPSAEDFIKAFDAVNARHIFVFPNNSNIILAARQAASMYDRSDVHVFKNKDLGSGYVGAATIDRDSSPDEIIAAVDEAMAGVVTGYVSPAVRTTDVGGVHIENGDNIAFIGKTMVSSEKEKSEAIRALAERILSDEDKFMLTAFFGESMSDGEREEFVSYMKDDHPDIELYTVDGGQPVYSCIIAAE